MEWTTEDINSDDDLAGRNHSLLLKNAAATYGKKIQRIKPPSRNEPSLEISEFHLLSRKVKREELAKALASSLDEKGKYINISQKVKKIQKLTKPLPAPLERPEAAKIKRTVAFDNAKSLMTRWEPIVNTNRIADQLNFPLNVPYFKLTSTKKFLSNMKAKTPLEKEIESVLGNNVTTEKENQEIPDRKTFFLNRKEILEQRRELARIKMQQSYREAKARRQNKIKSKKYHRILRRENTKKQLREFEELQKKDPEAALKKLDELEKTRAEERVTLRHRSTGQWAKNKAVHAKYDTNCRQMLAQQLNLGKDLTQKINLTNNSDNEDAIDDHDVPIQGNNPWLQKQSNEYEEFNSNYRKFWDSQHSEKSNVQDSSVKSNDVENSVNFKTASPSFTGNKCNKSKTREIQSKTIKDKNGFIVSEMDEESSGKCIDFKKSSANNSSLVNNGWKCTEINVVSKVTASSENDLENKDLDDIFEDMELKLQNKFEKRVSLLKNTPESQKKTEIKKPKEAKKTSCKTAILRGNTVSVQSSINEEMIETTANLSRDENTLKGIIGSNINIGKTLGKHKKESLNDKNDNVVIDPKNFISVSASNIIKTHIPDISEADDDNPDEIAASNILTIAEAFTEDDVVAEFRQEKETIAEKDLPKDVDLTLPGWGEWTGKGLPAQSQKKKKRFILKAPKYLPRKDDNKDTVIINEAGDSKARIHQVNDLPFPYAGVESFEASIRAPIGSTWVPETAYQKLIVPKVSTLMGSVIEPLTEDVLIDQSKEKEDFGIIDEIDAEAQC